MAVATGEEGHCMQPQCAATNQCHSSNSSSSSGGSSDIPNKQHAAVGRQPDGLPRLPSHLTYEPHYEPSRHCPVCSRKASSAPHTGIASHAASYAALPATAPSPPPRAIDRHGLALLKSLRRPKLVPAWWGHRHAAFQDACGEVLESTATHYAVICLTLLDLAVVVAELILSSIFACHGHTPEAVHVAEDALHWTSISILCLFVAELIARLIVFGFSYFIHSLWHLLDAVVVISSLVLELSLHGQAQEVASLLIFLRLWRLLRVMHGVAEAMELNHETELEKHHRLVDGLQKDLAVEQRRVQQLECDVSALSAAAAGAEVDVAATLRQAATGAVQPDATQAPEPGETVGGGANSSAAQLHV